MTDLTELEIIFFRTLSQVVILFVVTASVVVWVFMRRRHAASIAKKGRDTILLSRSNPSAQLVRYLGRYMSKGNTLILSIGDGMYPARVDDLKRKQWFNALGQWISSGVRVVAIASRPTDRLRVVWAELLSRGDDSFILIELDRDKVQKKEDREDIERLDTFHPILVMSRSGKPIAMWIEHYHPLEEIEAHHVEFVGPKDTKGDERFSTYLAALRRLVLAMGCEPTLFDPPLIDLTLHS